MKFYDIDNLKTTLKINNKATKGYYSGKYAKNILGSFPHGRGKFVLENGDIYEGYWLNGFMTEGMVNLTSGVVLSGAFEQSKWQKGKIDFPNGDYIKGYIDNNKLIFQEVCQQLENNNSYILAKDIKYSPDKSYVVFDGEVVQQTNNNLTKTIEIGLFKKDCIVKTKSENLRFWVEKENCELQKGSVKIATKDGYFEGEKLTQFYLEKTAKKDDIASDWGGFSEYTKENNIIVENVYNTKYKGKYISTKGDIFEGVFFPTESKYSLRFVNGKLSISIKEGNFEGELNNKTTKTSKPILIREINNKKQTSNKKNIYKNEQEQYFEQKYYTGVLKDKENNTTYRGIFSYQGIFQNPCAGGLFSKGLQFYEGDITIQQGNEKIKLSTGANKFKDESVEQMVQNEKTFALHDAKGILTDNNKTLKGEFFVQLKRNKAVDYKFKSGKVDFVLDDEKEFHGITCDYLHPEAKGYNACDSEVFAPKIKYNGISLLINSNGTIEKKGLFDKDFNLIEGVISARVYKEKNTVRIINVDLCIDKTDTSKRYLNGTIEFQIKSKENEKILQMTEEGIFNTKLVLEKGKVIKTTPQRNIVLNTENGLDYSGKAIDTTPNACSILDGDFRRFDKAERGSFKFVKGNCKFEFEKAVFQAQYNQDGIDVFNGKKYAGTVFPDKTNLNQQVLYATNDYLSVREFFEKKQAERSL